MELKRLGFDEWFEARAHGAQSNGMQPARVVAVDRERFLVQGETGVVPAEITGKLMYGADSPLDYPTVGDWVQVQFIDDEAFAIIHSVLPRKSLLTRKTPGKRIEFQLIGANIDTALIMQSLDANYNIRRLERYLVMVRQGGIQPLFLLSKSDLVAAGHADDLAAEIRSKLKDLPVLHFSNLDDTGPAALEEVLAPAKTYCLLGSSGVGKTTLLNRLMGEDRLATRDIREKDGKGRHTTTRRQLIRLPGGAMLIDTPGMRELGNIDVDAGIADTFGDIAALADTCRFKDCTHTHEQGCAVLAALERGDVESGHLQNYMKLQKESAFHRMSYLEKKHKDKQFGKMVKSIMKNKKQ